MSQLPARRAVLSLSLSARNPDAIVVAQALAERTIPLRRGGGQILAWAAAYLLGHHADPPDNRPTISDEDLDALLDAF